jgi:hypothetical protein
LLPVPYDFDYSGFVDAPYAAPPARINIASVRTRRYLGYCKHNAEIAAVAAEFNARRPQLLAVIDETPLLEPEARAKARKYTESFFQSIGSAEAARRLETTCV